jgi:phosphoglycolate phosphatase
MTSSAKLSQGFLTTAPQAVLFDLDGTLVDSVQDIFVAVNLLLAELGMKTRTRDEVTMWVGNGARMLIDGLPAHEGLRALWPDRVVSTRQRTRPHDSYAVGRDVE